MESYRSTNGRIRLPASPSDGSRYGGSRVPKATDFLSPKYNSGSRFIDSRIKSDRNSVNSQTPTSMTGDGLALAVPLPSFGKMRKSCEKLNLKRLVDTKDPHFPGLKRLKFRGKELNCLPQDVFQLKELELLDLSPEREACLYYKLPEVPPSISRLVNLKVLILDTNELLDLPPEIGYLSQLEHLALSNNCLSKLPEQITMLHNLSTIHLANNRFATFPPQLTELTMLTFLDLSDNLIQKIPKTIKKLRLLETFIIFANKLTEIPDELCELVELRMLWLGNNCVKILPKNFGKLKYLDWDWHYTSTTLDGNPLEHPPMEICKQGMQAINEYLQRNWSKIQRGQPVYTPDPIYVRDQTRSRDTPCFQEDSRFLTTLDVDPHLVRNMRRGSIPIPSPVPDGLAAMQD